MKDGWSADAWLNRPRNDRELSWTLYRVACDCGWHNQNYDHNAVEHSAVVHGWITGHAARRTSAIPPTRS